MEKLEGLDHVGVARSESTRQENNVQFRSSGSLKRKAKPVPPREESSETAPFLPGKKASGYNIRKYDTTTTATMTEGFTGTDISVNT